MKSPRTEVTRKIGREAGLTSRSGRAVHHSRAAEKHRPASEYSSSAACFSEDPRKIGELAERTSRKKREEQVAGGEAHQEARGQDKKSVLLSHRPGGEAKSEV